MRAMSFGLERRILQDSDAKRFWAKVDKTGDCWLWMDHSQARYGRFTIDYIKYMAHQVAYVLETGNDWPANKIGCHQCDNTRCVRPHPSHVVLSTPARNVMEKVQRQRACR